MNTVAEIIKKQQPEVYEALMKCIHCKESVAGNKYVMCSDCRAEYWRVNAKSSR